MNQSAVYFKKSSINKNLGISLISKGKKLKPKRSKDSSKILEDKYKNIIEDEKILNKAHKNVIRVINTILGNIEEEKINGKTKITNINSRTQTKRGSNATFKNKKLMVCPSPKSVKPSKKGYKRIDSKDSNNCSNISKNSLKNKSSFISINSNKKADIPVITIIKAEGDDNKSKRSLDKSYKIIKLENLNGSNMSKNRKFCNNSQLKSPSKKLDLKKPISHYNSCNVLSNEILTRLSIKNISSNKNSILYNEEDNSISISSSSFTPLNAKKRVRKSISKKEKSLKLSGKNLFKQKSSSKSVNKGNKSITKRKKSTIQPLSILGLNDDKIQKKLYEYENNELTDIINKLPESKLCKEKNNEFKKRRSVIFTKELKDIIELNHDVDTLISHFQKCSREKNYRCLLFKGTVYDSLNDDEETEEEIDDYYCYFEPDSTLLYILDFITFISTLIVLIYLPYYLAKSLYFCYNIFDINTFIFYLIDFNYIIDLIISFYRSYYDFDEYLVKDNIYICIHYFKTWFILDLICAIPIYTILKSLENKCLGQNIYIDKRLNNNGIHSHYYNSNSNNIHYLFLLIKSIKTFKLFNNNITIRKIGQILYGSDFLSDWGNVLLYSFFLISFLNFGSCLFIFIGRNSVNNWIFLNTLDTNEFYHIYIGAIYYIIETVTTVGYGDLIGNNFKEIGLQIIMLIVGTCIYSWLVSSISNYIQKMNERNTKYGKKLEILEEIKLNNPHLNHKLYDKILRLIHYRKYHEDETEKNIVLNSLPNSLKNLLIIEMYKKFINDFVFFKGIDNREFIVQVISKLKPIIGIKGDTLVKEGEYIDEIIFIKEGILSLEIRLDLNYPEESIEQFMAQNGYIASKKEEVNNNKRNSNKFLFNKSNKHVKNAFGLFYYDLIRQKTRKYISSKTINEYYKDTIDTDDSFELDQNIKAIKILDIRKNEHFGDVLMFLNKKSPLFVRVRSNKADLLLLKKLDALKISNNYPSIWKKIIRKPLSNSKLIQNLTLKMLATFCNYYGIKTNIFKKLNRNKEFPSYYLKPILNIDKPNSKTKKKSKVNSLIDMKKTKESDELSSDLIDENQKEKNDIIYKDNKTFSYGLDNSKKDNLLINEINATIKTTKTTKNNSSSLLYRNINENIIKNNTLIKKSLSSDKNKKKLKLLINDNENNNDNINITQSFSFKNKNNVNNSDIIKDENTLYSNKKYKPTLFQKASSNISNNEIPLNSIKENTIQNNFKEKNMKFKDLDINDEIYPGEDFTINTYESENSHNFKYTKKKDYANIISDKVYINNFNIIKSPIFETYYNNNYNLQNLDKNEKKIFNNLEISSTTSTLEINSTYENLNSITNNRYASNGELQKKTKIFLIEECNLTNKKSIYKRKSSNMNTIKRKSKKKSPIDYKMSSDIYERDSFIRNNIQKTRSSSSIKNLFNSQKQKYIENSNTNTNTNKFNKERLGHKFDDKKMSSSISLGFKYNLHDMDNSHNIIGKKNISQLNIDKKIILEENQDANISQTSFVENKTLDINDKNDNKKNKKRKEMDIISFNIQKSSQNLNEPEVFYADLFSQLIIKDKGKSRLHSSSKKWKNDDSYLIGNDIHEIEEEKSKNSFTDIIK